MRPMVEKNETFLRSKVTKSSKINEDQTPFGSLIVVGKGAAITFKLTHLGSQFYSLACSLKNNFITKRVRSFKFELSVIKGDTRPINIVTKSREVLELLKDQSNNIGCKQICLDYFQDRQDILDITFKFELLVILTPDEEPPISSGSSLLSKLSFLYKDENLRDLKFRIGSEELMAHRIVLSARSKVFHAMLQYDTQERREGVIKIEDCSVESFKAFLNYCYTGEMDINVKNKAIDLLILADKYDVQCLKMKCEEYLCGVIEKSNAISYLIAAYLSNSNLLKATALVKIKPYVKEVLQSEDACLLNQYPLLFKDIMLMLDA